MCGNVQGDRCRAASPHSHLCHPWWAARGRCGRSPTWKRVRSLCSQGMALCRAGRMTPRVLATRMTNTAAMRSLQGSGRGGGVMPRVLGSQHDRHTRHLQPSGQRQDQSSMLPKASQPWWLGPPCQAPLRWSTAPGDDSADLCDAVAMQANREKAQQGPGTLMEAEHADNVCLMPSRLHACKAVVLSIAQPLPISSGTLAHRLHQHPRQILQKQSLTFGNGQGHSSHWCLAGRTPLGPPPLRLLWQVQAWWRTWLSLQGGRDAFAGVRPSCAGAPRLSSWSGSRIRVQKNSCCLLLLLLEGKL